jgi:hypothetical protein
MKDGQTFGQWLKWDFEVNGNLEIRNKNGKQIYWEDSYRFWVKREYDSQGNPIYYEGSDGYIKDYRIPEVIEHTNGHKYQLIK